MTDLKVTDINWEQRLQAATLTVNNLIEGQLAAPQGASTISKYAPHNGELLYQLGEGSSDQADQAVASARASFDDGRWSNLTLSARQAVLLKLADLIEANREELALYECLM